MNYMYMYIQSLVFSNSQDFVVGHYLFEFLHKTHYVLKPKLDQASFE